MDDFLFKAMMAGGLLSLMAGPLGTFVVWRRMAYFGDSIAHSALLGVVLGLLLNLHVMLGILTVSVLMALLLVISLRSTRFSSDTMLGILAHGTLSVGLVAYALSNQPPADLTRYLFGDILSVQNEDIRLLAGVSSVVLALLSFFWRDLIQWTIHEDIARVEGVRTPAMRMILILMIAVVVAVSIKIVGVLLITSLLILPAAGARFVSVSPPQMVAVAAFLGLLAVLLGLGGSYHYDAPTGPAIVVAALSIFGFLAILQALKAKFHGALKNGTRKRAKMIE